MGKWEKNDTIDLAQPVYFSAQEIDSLLSCEEMVEELRKGFLDHVQVPKRHHHPVGYSTAQEESTLLLMPAWNNSLLGMKQVMVVPGNKEKSVPTIQGTYLLSDVKTGELKAFFEAKELTNHRTAAASVLAAKYLAKENANSLLVMGTGALAPYFIRYYIEVLKIEKVAIWGRDTNKSKNLVESIESRYPDVEFSVEENIENNIGEYDIISTLTLSQLPIVKGGGLQEGQHLDLVGSYKQNMREADDDCILKSTVFVDTKEAALLESGDLVIPIQNGVLTKEDIKADLFELCAGAVGRSNENQVTLFKSVGHALEDLVAASLVYQKSGRE